jgi:hypothetical protein
LIEKARFSPQEDRETICVSLSEWHTNLGGWGSKP